MARTFTLSCEFCGQSKQVLSKYKHRARFCSHKCGTDFEYSKPLALRVEEGCMPVTECGCWIWLKGTLPAGYGIIGYKYERILAHRASWEAFRGPIPEGMHVLHRCNITSCVNPDHLYLGTCVENARDRIVAGTQFYIPSRRGEDCAHALLNDSAVRQIRASSESYGALATRFKVSQQTISAVKNNIVWKHVT